MAAIDRLPKLSVTAAAVKQGFRDKLVQHRRYVREFGEDMPEIRNWKWTR